MAMRSTSNGHLSVIIADGESAFALPVLRCLSRAPNVTTTVVSRTRWAPSRFSLHQRRYVVHGRANDDERRIADLCRLSLNVKADIVLAAGQRGIRLLSAYAKMLSRFTRVAHVPDLAAFDIAADKWLLAEFLGRHGIAHPSTILHQTSHAFEQDIAALAFPVLIKPAQGGSGHGIEFFETPTGLRAYLRDRKDATRYIVQSYINGYDIDCSVLCQDGKILAHTIQRGFLPGYRRFGPPSGVDFVHDEQTFAVASRLVEALHWSGIAHIDLRFDVDRQHVKVIEINPRYWGSLLGSLIAGVNFPHVACLAGVGAEVPKNDYRPKRYVAGRAAMRMFAQGVFKKQAPALTFEGTGMGFFVRDPLPELLGGVLRGRAAGAG